MRKERLITAGDKGRAASSWKRGLSVVLPVLAIGAVLLSQPVRADGDRGEALYNRYCAFCHGEGGRGDGPAADSMYPAPRDFVEANYRIRTTPWKALPTDQDLMDVITDGLKHTPMPAWFNLPEDDRSILVDYIKSFSERFRKEEIPPRIEVPGVPKKSQEIIAKGKEVYGEAKCFLCHGDEGRGDGPITVALESEWLMPYRARDLQKGWTYKRGDSVEDIYMTLVTGFNGTPMGSYKELLSSDELWALAYYVESISRKDGLTRSVALEAKYVQEGVPSDPTSRLWESAQRFTVPVAGQIIINPRWWKPSAEAVSVKALYDDTDIALLIEWSDVKRSLDDVLPDAVEVKFPVSLVEGARKPFFLTGDMTDPIYVIGWKARGGSSEEEALVREFNSGGEDSLTLQSPENQHMEASAVWEKGQWKVVLKRKLSTGDRDDLQLEKGRLIPVAFSLWDGMKGEAGSRMSVTPWYYLRLETSTPWTAYLYIVLAVLGAVGVEFWFIRRIGQSAEDEEVSDSESI